jgi:hypothetical protein
VIVFFVGREARVTITSYLRTWAARLAPKVQLVYYEDLAHADAVPAAHAYVFTDLERRLDRREQLGALADRLAATPGAPRILNHPRGVLGRYELLRALHDRGVNPFDVHRLDRPISPRFPVFVRDPDEHDGPMTPILETPQELERELDRLRREGHDLARLVADEFEYTRPADGLFRKHVTYDLGDEILHGNLCFSDHWVVKFGGASTEEQLAEQAAEWFSTEHVAELRAIAELAGIRYGRYDYTVADGRLRIWELNTNPRLLETPSWYPPKTLELRKPLAERITDALDRLDGGAGAAVDRPPIPLRERRARRLFAPLARTRRRASTGPRGGARPVDE